MNARFSEREAISSASCSALFSSRWFLYLGEFVGLLEALLLSAVMTLLVLTVERQEEISEKETLLSCHRHL